MYRVGCGLLCILVLWLHCAVGDLFTDEGILVRRGGDARGISGLWTVLIVIHPPPRPDFSSWINHVAQDLATLTAKGQAGQDDINAWKERLDAMRGNLNEFNNIDLVGPYLSRTRRAPLDVIGSLSNLIFGTATQQQVDILTGAIRESQGRIDALYHQGDNMISIMNQTRRYIQDNKMDIDELKKATESLSARVLTTMRRAAGLEKTIDQLHIRNHVNNVIGRVDRSIHLYLHQVALFHRQRLQLERGYLTDDILPPAYLHDILNQIRLRKHETAPLRWHYQYITVAPLADSSNELSFRAIIPGLAREKYALYHLQYFPVPLGSGLLRQVNGKARVAMDGVSSASFTPDTCTGSTPTVCRIDRERLQPTCEANLLMSRQPEHCVVSVTPRGNRTSMVYRGEDQVSTIILAAFFPVEATLYCRDHAPTAQTYLGLNRIELGPSCVLQNKEWRVRGIDLGQSVVTLPQMTYIDLPAINLTFPERQQQELFEKLKFKDRLDIPMISSDDVASFKPVFGNWTPIQTGTVTGGPVLIFIVLIIVVCCVYYKIVGCHHCKKKVVQVGVRKEISAPLLPPPVNPTYNQTNYHFSREHATSGLDIEDRDSLPVNRPIFQDPSSPMPMPAIMPAPAPSQLFQESINSLAPFDPNSALVPMTTMAPKPPRVPRTGPRMQLAAKNATSRPHALASAMYGPRGYDASGKAQKRKANFVL